MHAVNFLTGLETLLLRDQNISCLPQTSALQRLKKLRHLDLSGTTIAYLPPSLLFQKSLLKLNLTGSPVSFSLNWSHHGIQDSFNWSRVAHTLPYLTSLDLSANDLSDAHNLMLDDLPMLRRLDVSDNPKLTPSQGFLWWKRLSEHPMLSSNTEFIGLANVGLNFIGNSIHRVLV